MFEGFDFLKGHSVFKGGWSARSTPPRGVILFKLDDVHERGNIFAHSLCAVTEHFNKRHGYPVYAFHNKPVADGDASYLRSLAAGAELRFLTSHFSAAFYPFPPGMPVGVQQRIMQFCGVTRPGPDTPCKGNAQHFTFGRLFMYSWHMLYFAMEPALKDFDYYMFLDTDAYALKRWSFDPFKLMRANGLNFVTNKLLRRTDQRQRVVINAARDAFGNQSLKSKFFDELEQQVVFDDAGNVVMTNCWGGFFHAGRLSLFRSSEYQNFASQIILSGAVHLQGGFISQQYVVTIGVAAASGRNQIWGLPNHGYPTYMYHYWYIDTYTHCRLENGSIAILGEFQGGFDLHHSPSITRFMESFEKNMPILGMPYTEQDRKANSMCYRSKARLGRARAQAPRPRRLPALNFTRPFNCQHHLYSVRHDW